MLRRKHSHQPHHRHSHQNELDNKLEFFLTASHQLKSPVAIIQWCLQSMLEKDTIDTQTRNLAQKALGQADAMSLLIADMLRMFRIMDQPKEIPLEPVLLNHVIDEAVHQCEPAGERRGVRIVKGPTENLPTILANESYIKQAVINLIDNAVKYSQKGGVVTITGKTSGGYIEISVEDRGIGIPDLEQERIFHEFFRGEAAKEQTADGSGLGLVLVKHILETFGGSISFTSKLHHGSVFTIRLPHGDHSTSASKGR